MGQTLKSNYEVWMANHTQGFLSVLNAITHTFKELNLPIIIIFYLFLHIMICIVKLVKISSFIYYFKSQNMRKYISSYKMWENIQIPMTSCLYTQELLTWVRYTVMILRVICTGKNTYFVLCSTKNISNILTLQYHTYE